MRAYRFDHLNDGDLLITLTTRIVQERSATAELLALIAEVDLRRLYLPAGYPSMREYCVGELGLSQDAAYKRIEVARKAREFPAIFAALADGRLHMTAVLLLAPHLTPQRADELLAAAAGKTKSEVELLIAARFPRNEWIPLALAATRPRELAPERVGVAVQSGSPSSGASGQLAPERVGLPARRSKTPPIAADRYLWQLTVGRSVQDKLERARELLSHQVPSGDRPQVLERALDALITQLEKRRFATTHRPRPGRSSATARTIPAQVKRDVVKRDQGRCTFVGDTGRRCESRRFLEYDHIDPVARGGQSTIANLRLRCRAHNQCEAERAFGDGFMHEKREAAGRLKQARNARREQMAQQAHAQAEAEEERAGAIAKEQAKDVLSGLRELGYRAEEARRGAEFSATVSVVTLEERMRAALKYLCPKARTHGPIGVGARA